MKYSRNNSINYIVLLTVDCLRADTTHQLDYISSLRNDNVTIQDCHTTGSGTPTCMPGIMQSRLSTDYGGKPKEHPLIPEVPTLSETLSEADFECGGWHSNTYTSSVYDYDRGFDTFVDLGSNSPSGTTDQSYSSNNDNKRSIVDVGESVSERLNIKSQAKLVYNKLIQLGLIEYEPRVRAEMVIDSILHGLPPDTSSEKKFAWGHLMDLHSPYIPPEKYRDNIETCPTSSDRVHFLNSKLSQPQNLTTQETNELRGLYKANAEYVDDQVERIVTELKKRDIWDNTLLIFTADHGEMFNDRPIPDDYPYQHPNYLSDYSTRVPLIFAGGGLTEGIVTDITSTADIPATVCCLIDEQIPKKWHGVPIESTDHRQRDCVYSVTRRGKRQDFTEGTIPPDTLHVARRTSEDAVLWWSNEARDFEFYSRVEAHHNPMVHESRVTDVPEHANEYVADIFNQFSEVAERITFEESTDEKLSQSSKERLRELGYLE